MNDKKYSDSYKHRKSSLGGFRGPSFFLFLLLFSFGKLFAQSKSVPVFVSGNDGYKSFRIPAIVKAKNDDLLAFCEGRVNNAGDFGNIKIVLKRSADDGKTWSALQIVASNDSLQAGNPAPLVDLTDPRFPEGRIFLFYNTGDGHEMELRKGKETGKYRVVSLSKDGGETWDTTFVDHNLPDPICEGSLLNIGTKKGKSVLAFCNNNSKKSRDSLALRISFDEGRNWEKKFLIEPKDTGYSDIAETSKKSIGVFYEADGYKEIRFTVVKWK
jgi:hypothetical protein